MKYLNVYRISQAYGGPEEGGWYYNELTPLGSVRAGNKRQRKKAEKKLLEKFGYYRRGKYVGQILGGNPADLDSDCDFEPNDCTGLDMGTDVRVKLERCRAHYWPRPYYA